MIVDDDDMVDPVEARRSSTDEKWAPRDPRLDKLATLDAELRLELRFLACLK